MKYKYYFPAVLTFFFALVFTNTSDAQDAEQRVTQHILHKDSMFWQSYNRCDTAGYDQFFSNDVEFYHDKGGITLGADNMALSIKKNLCSNSDFRIRREEVKGTVKVFPLQNNGVIYGAILSGEHFFYILEKGKARKTGWKSKVYTSLVVERW